MNIKTVSAATLSLMLTTTLASAGGHDILGRTQTVAPAPTAQNNSWTGWYGGLSYGTFSNGEFEIDIFPDAPDTINDSDAIGGFVGNLQQSGDFVYGFEFAFSAIEDATVDAFVSETEVESPLFDMKYRAGYAVANLLPYGVVSLSTHNIQGPAVDVPSFGFGIGAGLDVAVGPNMIIGAEYLYRTSNSDVETTTGGLPQTGEVDVSSELITLRVGYRF